MTTLAPLAPPTSEPASVTVRDAVPVPFPGTPVAMDGTAAVVAVETAASDAAGAYPITPSTGMGEGWAEAAAERRLNVNGRSLLFFEPEGEHAAAAVTAGLSMTGLRATNFSSGQGVVYMHESLYPAVGKRLTYVLNVACRAITKQALNVHAGHDDYHAVDDSGFFQLFAKDPQGAADLTLIAHRIAELALNPGICAQDGFLTSHVIETLRLPERELVRAYLGDPADTITTPTPAQRLVFGDRRRRIPEMFDVDRPLMLGIVENQDSYAQGVAAQRPFFFDHVAPLADRAMAEYAALTGRRYRRASGYRTEDAEVVIVGQGSVVANAEAVADWLRAERGLRVGVVDLTMFRPFPSDLVTRLLAGKRAAVVLERVDQPLAADAPLLRELRAACGQAVENGRASEPLAAPPHPGLPALAPADVPDFYSGCFGLGSRDLQPGDLVAAVENALPGGRGRRQFYLGIAFPGVEPGPAPRPERERLLAAYPGLADLALPRATTPSLLPEGAVSVRIHSVGGWGAISTGKSLAHAVFELLGLHVKANPRYGSEKKGQPTTFHAVLAPSPIRLNGEPARADVVLSPDPGVFRHSDPLAGLAQGGVFVLQGNRPGDVTRGGIPPGALRRLRAARARLWRLDGLGIARDEAARPSLRYRMQGAAFLGAFFRTSGLLERHGLDAESLFAALERQLAKKFGQDPELVAANLRVIRRGFEEVAEVELDAIEEATPADAGAPGEVRGSAAATRRRTGLDDRAGFACESCSGLGDPVADPFAALAITPAATGAFRDLSGLRMEIPELNATLCTGCGHCWTQCPDAAIPALVVEPPALLAAAARASRAGAELHVLLPALGDRLHALLAAGKGPADVPDLVRQAGDELAVASELSRGERAALRLDVELLAEHLAEMGTARTAPFFTAVEKRQPGAGGLLAITVNPDACKGCNLCVEVCPEAALAPVPQNDEVLARRRRAWSLWRSLPDTPDRFVKVSDLDAGVGVLHTLLLKRDIAGSMTGGDGACTGCGEKTALHLVLAAAEAAARPRAARFVAKLDGLVAGLREALAGAEAAPPADEAAAARAARLSPLLAALEDLHWRYVAGPSGRGRAALGIANSTGCSSVWASTYPFNPYPYPWANHLFQDSPSLGIGLFEGLMRRMADGFAAVRHAELELSGEWNAAVHEPLLARFGWEDFTEEELRLCPPLVVVGGDGAMLDIGLQNLSRLLASGKPLKVVVLDTQVYSNTGGQACTSSFLGQVADMSPWGQGPGGSHGKREQRKELALLAIAHRNVFVLQSSQAAPGHLLAGVLRGLASPRPAVFNLYTPCQAEHGLPESGSTRAARLALESRAFPFLVYDPDAGETLAERLSLDGNPAGGARWPTTKVTTPAGDGSSVTMELPLTTADWAATEPRFERHFHELAAEELARAVPLHELLEKPAEGRDGAVPFVHARRRDGSPSRLAVSREMVALCEDRASLWALLREMAGREPLPAHAS